MLRLVISRSESQERTVLMADSDLTHRSQVATLLAEQGYRVLVASSGDHALAQIRLGGVDLLVSAMVMRGMDGLELLRAVRELAPDLAIIAVSAGAEAIDKIYLRAALLLGANAAHSRPTACADFLQDIQNLVSPSVD